MPLPPKGHPVRPLRLAVRSCRLLGIVFLIFGLLVLLPVLVLVGGPARGGSPAAMASVFLLIIVMAFLLVPGLLYLIFSIYLAHRRSWAVVALLIVAGLHGVVALFALADSALNSRLPAVFGSALWVAALAQLIYHLTLSPAAIRFEENTTPRGFAPIMPPGYPPSYPPGYPPPPARPAAPPPPAGPAA